VTSQHDIQAVIFDIGNVLIEWQPEQRYNDIIGQEKSAAFFKGFDLHGLMNDIDAGAPFSKTITDRMAQKSEWGRELVILRDQWCDLAQPVIEQSVVTLRALRQNGVKVFVLSNFGAENFKWSEQQFPFLKEFDRRYISGEMMMRKPNPSIYQAVEEDCQLSPRALLFADDRLENIEAAQARGWQTHLFQTPEAWGDCLLQHGLVREDQIT